MKSIVVRTRVDLGLTCPVAPLALRDLLAFSQVSTAYWRTTGSLVAYWCALSPEGAVRLELDDAWFVLTSWDDRSFAADVRGPR